MELEQEVRTSTGLELVAVVEFGNRAEGERLVPTALEDADQGVVANDGHETLVGRSCNP